MTQEEMYEASFGRPRDYFRLSLEAQWAIDKALGILDWDGFGLTPEQSARYKAHYASDT
jgi:hypothetical protein